MEPREPADSVLDSAFTGYQTATLPLVSVPGVDAVWRTVYRRQRAKTAATGALAAAAIAVSAGTYVSVPRQTGAPGDTAATPTSATTTSPTPSAASSPRPSFPLSSASHDLMISGPNRLTLTPAGGRYAATLTVVAANVGRDAYEFGSVRVVVPSIVEMSFEGIASPGLSACGQLEPASLAPGLHGWECISDLAVIPARGGQTTYTFGLVANMAPQPERIELAGAKISVVARGPGDAANHYHPVDVEDATPANNEVAVHLILAPS